MLPSVGSTATQLVACVFHSGPALKGIQWLPPSMVFQAPPPAEAMKYVAGRPSPPGLRGSYATPFTRPEIGPGPLYSRPGSGRPFGRTGVQSPASARSVGATDRVSRSDRAAR